MARQNNSDNHYLSFRIGAEWYGIHLNNVIEVLHMVALEQIPGTPDDVLGLMTLRRMVIPVIDLRRRFGLNEAPLTLDTPIIALITGSGPMAVVVDDVDDVMIIDPDKIQNGGGSDFVRHVARLPDRLIRIFEAETLGAVPALHATNGHRVHEERS